MPENQIPQPTRDFLEDMLKESGTAPDSEELKELMVQDLFERLNSQLVLVLGKHLSEEQLGEYGNLSLEDPQKGNEYLSTVLPNAPALFLEAMAEFRQVFLQG